MMYVCLHDSFGVNYAFCCSSSGKKGRDSSLENRWDERSTHIFRLPPGRVVTFTNLRNHYELGYETY
jgi:hypothetical protein